MDKLKALLQSRKFWALILAMVGIWASYFSGAITAPEAINASVAALAGYMIGTGIEASGQGVVVTTTKTVESPPTSSGAVTTSKTVTEKTPDTSK